MLKIEEGMYVRTEKGEIKKVFQYDKQEDNLIWCTLNCHATIKSSIVKASYNIIDLIGVGDYVNGVEVIGKEFDNFNKEYLQCGVGDYVICTFEVKDIKTILTKEQYENNCYKVDDKQEDI